MSDNMRSANTELCWFLKTFFGFPELSVQMTCFVKVCTEFIPISVDCIIQVDIHAALDADNKILWFNKTHKKELLELVLEKAKLRLLKSQTVQSLDKKEKVAGQFRETAPEVLTGKNIKLGISFRKCAVRYHSLLATADGLGDAKVYQPLSCFKEKLIVYSYPLDRSSEVSDVAASSRHRVANENIGKNPSSVTEVGVSRISDGKITSFTHLRNKNSSEAVGRNQAPLTPRPPLVTGDISEVDERNLSGVKKKKVLGNKKKCVGLSQFKFRRTKAIQVLCQQRASPSITARIVRRRSRVLGLSCTDKEPEEENVQNRSNDALEKSSNDVGEKLDAHLGEKSGDNPEERNINVLNEDKLDKSIGTFKSRSRNISENNLKEGLGKKSTAASMEKSENRKSPNDGNVTRIQRASRNEFIEAKTGGKIDEVEKCMATLRSEKTEAQDSFLVSSSKVVLSSKKREHGESDCVASALPVSKKLCIKKSSEIELQDSREFPRHHTREVGQQCSGTMDKHGPVTGAEAIRSCSGFEGRGNSKGETRCNSGGNVNGGHNSKSDIKKFSAGESRRCSIDDFTQSSSDIRGSKDRFAGSSINIDAKESLGKDITRNKHRTDCNKSVRSASESCSVSTAALCNTDTVLSNKANQINQILDNDKNFPAANLKRLPTQKSRRLATKKKRVEKLLEDMNLDLSLGIVDDALTKKTKTDLGSVPPADRCTASSSTVDPQKKSSTISKRLSTSDDALTPSPLGYNKQIPDTSTSATDFSLENDIRLSSSVNNQPVTKWQDKNLPIRGIIPALCDATTSNFSSFSTGVADFTRTAGSQSCTEDSVAMVADTRLSACDPVVTKSPIQSDVITIESDNEGEVEAEIKAVRVVSDLTTFQLRHLVSCNETYLRKIFQGKIPCRRHQDYKAGKEKRRALSWNLPVGVVSDEQYCEILSSLKQLFCKTHEKYLDYLMVVLLPEMLVKIFMFVHDLSYEEAESRIEENAMELSQRNRFNF